MRPILTAFLLTALAFAGCIGGGFDETASTDQFGNSYDVFASQGEPPEDGAVVQGATARDLLTKAEALAGEWSTEANLFTVMGLEITEDAADGGPFMGPHPAQYDLYDAQPGDGKAPSWNYLYLSPEKVANGTCEFLFVHVAYNGFAVSYTFDPSSADYGSDDRTNMWVCGEHSPVNSRADWTVDSDEASAALAAADDRFTPATEDAEAVVWSLMVHHVSNPEDEANFDTVWLVGVFPELGSSGTADALTCFTPASDAAADTVCFDSSGQGTGGGDGGEAPEPLQPESGEGTVSFGFVFSSDQTDKFTIQNGSHPTLDVDYTVSTNQISGAYTIELLDVNGTVVDSADESNDGSAKQGTLTADAPAPGEWTVRVSGDSGTPEVDYTWCAQGFDHINQTVIDCS